MNDCPLCKRLVAGEAVSECGSAFAIRDAYPVSPGHTLVVPRRHEPDFLRLAESEQADLWVLARNVCDLLEDEIDAKSFNIGINVGAEAGQTVPHAHVHVIPRFADDVSDARGGIRWVIPKRARYWEEP